MFLQHYQFHHLKNYTQNKLFNTVPITSPDQFCFTSYEFSCLCTAMNSLRAKLCCYLDDKKVCCTYKTCF